MKIEEVPCNFVGSFKVGDNLVYNSDLLCSLVNISGDGSLNKSIVVQAGSLLEAGLSQIIYRAQNYSKEGVPNISEAERQEIEGKKVDKFATTIDVLKKYRVLDGLRQDIYEELHNLRRYRNKVHIQDSVNIPNSPLDEADLFTDELCSWALSLNAEVFKFLSQNLSRPSHINGYTKPLRVPSI